MSERHCPTCNRFKKLEQFSLLASGMRARDCTSCTTKRTQATLSKVRAAPPASVLNLPQRMYGLLPCREFPGVDIDAIHYKRGAVKKKVANG